MRLYSPWGCFWEAEGLSCQLMPFCDLSAPEQGDFLVLELGATGASLRVLWVTLMGTEGHRMEPRSQEFVIPPEVMLGPGQQVRGHCPVSGAWLGGQGSGGKI